MRGGLLALALLVALAAPGSSAADAARTLPVSDFGARCDGAADDTAALRRAVSAAGERGGGSVAIGRGRTCLVRTSGTYESVLRPAANVRIVGAEGATLKLDPANPSPAVMVDLGGHSGNGVDGVTFDMADRQSAVAVRMGTGARQFVRDSTFTHIGTAGVYVTGATSDGVIRGNTFVGAGYGVLTHDAATPTGFDVSGNVFAGGRTGDAIAVNTPRGLARDWSIQANVIGGHGGQGATGFGISVARGEGIDIVGNTITGVANEAVHVEDGSRDVRVIANTFLGNRAEAVYIVSGTGAQTLERISVIGNFFYRNGGEAGAPTVFHEGPGQTAHVSIVGNLFEANGKARTRSFAIRNDWGAAFWRIAGNTITSELGTGGGIWTTGAGSAAGGQLIERNYIARVRTGVYLHGRFDHDTLVRRNLFDDVTGAAIVNAASGSVRIAGNVRGRTAG